MTLASLLRAAAIVGLSLTPAAARAQSAEAEALFREGRRLLQAGQLDAGCAKLAASERAESSIGTLLNLGDCQERRGRHASAWAAFRKAEAMARRSRGEAQRQAEAGRRAAAVEPLLAHLVVDARAVDGLVIRRDGKDIDAAAWRTPVPVDPGTYELVAEAPGHRPWRTQITIAPRTDRWVVVPALVRVPAPAVARVRASAPRTRTWSRLRRASVIAAVAGVGALGGGGYLGMRSREREDLADARCPDVVCADPVALRWNDQAQTDAVLANGLFVVGGASVAAAAVLWLVGAPRADEAPVLRPTLTSGQVGVALAGRF